MIIISAGGVDYLCTRGSLTSSTALIKADPFVQYLMPSVATTLICWWQIAKLTKPTPPQPILPLNRVAADEQPAGRAE